MSIYSLVQQCQMGVSQAVFQEVSRALPLPIDHVSTVARIYGIQAIFFGPRDRNAGGQDVNFNRWKCRTDGTVVKSISLG
jgi:hypothetical protein